MHSIEPITEALQRYNKIDITCRNQSHKMAVQFRKRNGFAESPLDDFFAAKLREFMLYLHYDAVQKVQIEKIKPDPIAKQLLKEISKGCWTDSVERHPFEYFKGKISTIGFEPQLHRWSLEASFANSLALRLCRNPDRESVLQFLPVAYECRSFVRTFCHENPEFYG